MSTYRENPSGSEPTDGRTTFVYNSGKRAAAGGERIPTTSYEYPSGGGTATPEECPRVSPPAVVPATPVVTRSFEFRLTGSEVAEQRHGLGNFRPGPYIVATRCVRAYLTRAGELGAAASLIGGIEVRAALQDGVIVVVVQVEVALFRA